MTNQAPVTKWFRHVMSCGTVRSRLYIDGKETPYFVDVASVRAHYSYGCRIALWGSGLGPAPFGQKHGLRIAGFLGGFRTIAEAKHRAEMIALGE